MSHDRHFRILFRMSWTFALGSALMMRAYDFFDAPPAWLYATHAAMSAFAIYAVFHFTRKIKDKS